MKKSKAYQADLIESLYDLREADDYRADSATEFFGVTESSRHVGNESRIAILADSPTDIDRLAEIIVRAGARNVEGPGYHEGPGYYAIFFEDPSGNRLEICHRTEGAR